MVSCVCVCRGKIEKPPNVSDIVVSGMNIYKVITAMETLECENILMHSRDTDRHQGFSPIYIVDVEKLDLYTTSAISPLQLHRRY